MPPNYDVSLINPFLNAVVGVLGMMASVEATPGKPFINRKRATVGDITGSIGITGHVSGVMSLTLDKPVILKIVNNMLSENYTELNSDIADAVGELTNMIAGQARQDLAKLGIILKASTPAVVVGKGHEIQHVTSSPILAIPFTTPQGTLVVETSFETFPG
ncbi:MAG TPA: chemotaxis protein CheX [Desulfonatronum sp.]|mgnify:CR=1 FL=1|nr:chemotaxis protein CheX [Desulfonatronum sp.]